MILKNLFRLEFLFFPFLLTAQIKIPKNFIKLEESPSNGRKIEKLSIFFDNDYIKDEIMLVETKNGFPNYKLLIYLSSLKKQFDININSTSDFRIYPIQMKVNKKNIEYGYFEDGTSTFGRFIKLRYDAKSKNIQVIGYDSGYKSLPTERIDKSYNLLTGKYIVKRTKYNFDETKKVESFAGKNDFFKNKVFVNDLTVETLLNLDDVGRKHE